MARRYTIKQTFEVENPNDATQHVINAQIDIATLLSQRLQRNMRQGKVYHIHKAQVAVSPTLATGDFDLGGAFSGNLQFAPVTTNTRKAWNHAFDVWRKQKNLRINATGAHVRYDDFEVALTPEYVNTRTSTLYTSGLGDALAEAAVVYGVSAEGTVLTLEDLWESAQTQAPVSRFPIGNTTVKNSKYTEEFPERQVEFVGGAFSTFDGTPDSGGMYISQPTYIADSACLAGVVAFKGYLIAEDTATSNADTITISLILTVSVGNPLVYSAKKVAKKVMTYGRRRRTPAKRK